MQLNLLSCGAQRPDKRAIAQCIAKISGIDASLANELTDVFLQGEVIEVEVEESLVDSALRALRKLDIDYEIVE